VGHKVLGANIHKTEGLLERNIAQRQKERFKPKTSEIASSFLHKFNGLKRNDLASAARRLGHLCDSAPRVTSCHLAFISTSLAPHLAASARTHTHKTITMRQSPPQHHKIGLALLKTTQRGVCAEVKFAVRVCRVCSIMRNACHLGATATCAPRMGGGRPCFDARI